MAELPTLEALQAFHQELEALRDGRASAVAVFESPHLVQAFEQELDRFWQRPPKSEQSRNSVKSGKVTLDGDEYSVNENFQQTAFALSDELDLDELECVRLLLEAQTDVSGTGRSLLQCGIIRHHQQRKYALDVLRLLLECDDASNRLDDDEEGEGNVPEAVQIYVAERVLIPVPGSKVTERRIVPRCMTAIQNLRPWLQKLGDKVAAAQALGQNQQGGPSEEDEITEYSRFSLLQQHEALGVVLCRCIARRQATADDFSDFVAFLRKVDRYDSLLVHLMPAIGAYVTAFGSTEGGCDLIQVRQLNGKLFPADEPTWTLQFLHASVKAWWLAEYSGFYLDDPPEAAIPPNTDLDEEDRQRSKQFLDALKDGAFDFLLSVAADVKPPDWHDPVRSSIHQWLQRKSPALPTDSIPFAEYFQLILVKQLEVFVDAFISNLPDVLRKLRTEEDEQRQLSLAHEQDLDLERFLLIIAYAYEGRPTAAAEFFDDPDSNLAGFLQWASRRASTPLVTAFCEMLQALASDSPCATNVHYFLLDEGAHSSGKMRKAHSLTWSQIFKEIAFFLDKSRQKPSQAQVSRYRGPKPTPDFMETEPESAMMLECYSRLMTKLAAESEEARQFLLANPTFNLVETLFELASSPIPSGLRGSIFMAFKALMTGKSTAESFSMWGCLDTWVSGGYAVTVGGGRTPQQPPLATMDRILDEMSRGFEDPASFIQLLLSLIAPAIDSNALNDALPFPEGLGSSIRTPGVEVYVDYVMGLVFAKASELQDVHQIRVLRLACLDFMSMALSTFNEDLIILANETNLNIDSIISTTDLATYVRMHPFSRVMEWMFNDKIMAGLFNAIHQEPSDIGSAAPDSPLILGILRAVEVISKVLDLQATYLNLVRPLIKLHPNQRRQPVANAAYASFEDGLVTKLSLIVDLGHYCAIGHPDLTLASLKLLEKMSASPKIAAVWSGSSRYNHRNKAIVALEANGEHEVISRGFLSELTKMLETGREAESSVYVGKLYLLDFLYQCLQQTPNKPTIAHLLLGFKCGVDSITVEANGAFSSQTSLFHGLLRLFLETPSGDAQGIREWLVTLRARAMRVLHILWTSSLSSSIVIQELRDNEFLFHLLIRESVIQPELLWEGETITSPSFPYTDGSVALLGFMSLRSMSLEYIAMELCMISQGRMPSVKRRIFEALNGQITGDDNQPIQVPTIFDLYDFLFPVGLWDTQPPPRQYFQGVDLTPAVQRDDDGDEVHNLDLANEILLLKRSESSSQGAVITAQQFEAMESEEVMIKEYLVASNRWTQIVRQGHKVLKTWVKLLLIMIECNDFKGTAQTSFFLQALQAILPSLEAFASDVDNKDLELPKLAKVLLYKLDLSSSDKEDKSSLAVGNLIGDKLYQVVQICLQAIGKWSGDAQLRAVYYEICYWYLAGLSDTGPLSQSLPKTIHTIKVYGERLINVICDDAYSAEPKCQTAALILLGSLVNLDQQHIDTQVVDTLNKLNFIGVLVDSLRNIMEEWHQVFSTGNKDQQNFQNARLSLLQHLSQTRQGSKLLLQSNLVRALEASGLFAADPELQAADARALEAHFDVLAKVVRIMGAAFVCRGSRSIVLGRKFLTDHRMLVSHTLKRSAGIGVGEDGGKGLADKVEALAEGFMVVIAATEFLEYENEGIPELTAQTSRLFH